MTFGIKLISGLERKAAPAAEAVGAKVEKALVGKSSIVSDVVDLNNKARECFKDIFGMYGRQIKKDANACFDTKVVLGGFEHFKLKPSYAGYPHGFEFFGTKQNLIKYLKKK